MIRRFALAALLVGACDGKTGSGATTASASGYDDSGHQAEAANEGTDGGKACWPEAPPTDPELSVMTEWGSGCEVDADCVAALGPDAVCIREAIIYEMPSGYCSKPCRLPADDVTVVRDDPECDPDGGVHCVGVRGVFQRCIAECTDPAQCGREGYSCQRMPLIGRDGDPQGCFMDECCEGGCSR